MKNDNYFTESYWTAPDGSKHKIIPGQVGCREQCIVWHESQMEINDGEEKV